MATRLRTVPSARRDRGCREFLRPRIETHERVRVHHQRGSRAGECGIGLSRYDDNDNDNDNAHAGVDTEVKTNESASSKCGFAPSLPLNLSAAFRYCARLKKRIRLR